VIEDSRSAYGTEPPWSTALQLFGAYGSWTCWEERCSFTQTLAGGG